MSITDTLREAFDSCTVMAGVEDDFECVYITKSAALAYLDDIDDQCVALPVDADGEPIHPGDVIADEKNTYTVTSITFNSCGAVVRGCIETNRNEWPIDQTSKMHHVKHTTDEVWDILKEHQIRFYDLVTDMEHKRITNDEYARGIKSLDAEYADRIKEVIEHECD